MSITPFFHVYLNTYLTMNINKIKISGTTYNIQDENACNVVELTQAQYDALPASAKTSNSLFVITDATGADLSNYYTKSETSGATEISTALASKQTTLTAGTNITIVDNVISATAGDLSNYYTKSETSGATQISTALASKQDTLVSGTNIKTINNESILGSGNITIEGGGGKAVSGGTNISITTGETADTINCTLPISGYDSSILIKDGSNDIHVNSRFSQAFGSGNTIGAYGGYNQPCITVEGINNSCGTMATHVEGGYNIGIYGSYSHVEGAHNKLIVSTTHDEVCSHVEGKYNKVLNYSEHASGQYNVSNKANTTFGDSGNTLFSVGNGTADNARHNAFEIRQNGDIYLTKDGQDVKLQDQLGGGGSSYTAGDGIDITNDVISVTGKVDTSAITTSITSANTNTQLPSAKAVYDQLGGLKLVKLSQSAYDALSTKDSNTLYIIEEAPQCNIPSTANWHDVDTSFDRTTQIYGIDFSSGDGGNDGAGRDYSLEVKNANNTIYGITCHLKDRNAEMGDSDSIVISNADGTTYRQLDDTATINSFCEIFGEPMYISDTATIPSYEQCVNEECTEYDCLQWDEETGECIEQGDCINSECMEYQTTYFITALY